MEPSGLIQGFRITSPTYGYGYTVARGGSNSPRRPCIRCGRVRTTQNGRPGLCEDCRYTLTKAELDIWLS